VIAELAMPPSLAIGVFFDVLEAEANALGVAGELLEQQRQSIGTACNILTATRRGQGRRVIASGVGKAGLISRKVAATLSSTGTPAVFVHPVEALHGDLGAVCAGDCALLFSYSGETDELIKVAEALKRMRCEIVSITRSRESSLGKLSDVVLEMGDINEACELGLAPSCTTTAMLAIGDALALAVAKASGFTEREFATNHPAGMLGLKFRAVSEFMRQGSRFVCVHPEATVREVVRAVSQAKTGAAILTDAAGELVGIFTDGDLRRALLQGDKVLDEAVETFASVPCSFARRNSSVADAWRCMQDKRIEDLPVVSETGQQVVGQLCLKDIH
jgi:arabinose-5-phosphate isomerase